MKDKLPSLAELIDENGTLAHAEPGAFTIEDSGEIKIKATNDLEIEKVAKLLLDRLVKHLITSPEVEALTLKLHEDLLLHGVANFGLIDELFEAKK